MAIFDRILKLREENDTPKPFLQHLEELRNMFIKMAVTLIACMMGSLYFRKTLVTLVQEPLKKVDPTLVGRLQTLGVADSMTISFQLAFYAGIIISFPFLLFYLAQFVIPALTRKEKKYVFPGIAIGFGLFLTGVSLCYFFILPQTLAFFFKDAQSLDWTPTWTVREYFSFVTHMTIAFGLTFELPVVVLGLVGMGIISYDFMARTRPYAVILLLVLAAIIAPTPDVLTFLSMGTPMCLLYESCIWLAWIIDRKRKKPEEKRDLEVDELSLP